jgi:hypothetical protein
MWGFVILLIAIFNMQDDHLLLKKFDNTPSLLGEAKEILSQQHSDKDIYALQDELAMMYEERKQPYRKSIPYRHHITCSTGEHTFTEVEHHIYDPRKSRLFTRTSVHVSISERTLHEIRFHQGRFPKDIAKFLKAL